MILQRLVEYADRLEGRSMYEDRNVHWIVELDEAGNFLGFIRIGELRGEKLVVPARFPEGTPRLLCDDAKWTFGLDGSSKKHEAFVSLVKKCAAETGEPAVNAVVSFFDHGTFELSADLLPSDNATFRVSGVFPTDLPSVQEFWARETMRDDAVPGVCLVTGEEGMVEKVLPGKVKGVPGAPARGASLASAKHEATHHYGRKSSLNFPMSRSAAEKYTRALNALLRDRSRHVRIGPLVYVFWAQRGDAEEDFASFLTQPDPGRVQDLLLSPYGGREVSPIGANSFYALALAGNPGRIMVRDYIETTIPEVEENLKRWFRAQRVTDPHGAEGKPLGIFALAAAAYRNADDIIPRVLTDLLKAALESRQLSDELLARAVARNRVEGDVTRPRAALIQLVLAYGKEESVEESIAYQCGRLLAELEAVQAAAIPSAGATMTDKYYGMASTAPATAFGMLLRHSQPHMSKIRRDKPGLAYILQERVEEITAEIGSSFPRTLTLRDQGVFALGYYGQRAATRAERRERWEAKQRGEEAEAVEASVVLEDEY